MRIQFFFALLLSLVFASANAEDAILTFSTQDFPPFSRENNGSAAGPFADIVRIVCRRMQITCVIVVLPWRRTLAEVKLDELDGVFPISRLPTREADYYFIGPILESSFTVYARTGSAIKFHDAKDFSGYTIGVYGPSGISATLEHMTSDLPSVKLVMEINHLTVLKKLSAGRYGVKGFGFIDRDGAQYLMAEEHISNVQAVADIKMMDFYIGLSRKSVSPKLAAQFAENLAVLRASGELAAILKQYGLKPTQLNLPK